MAGVQEPAWEVVQSEVQGESCQVGVLYQNLRGLLVDQYLGAVHLDAVPSADHLQVLEQALPEDHAPLQQVAVHLREEPGDRLRVLLEGRTVGRTVTRTVARTVARTVGPSVQVDQSVDLPSCQWGLQRVDLAEGLLKRLALVYLHQ